MRDLVNGFWLTNICIGAGDDCFEEVTEPGFFFLLQKSDVSRSPLLIYGVSLGGSKRRGAPSRMPAIFCRLRATFDAK